MKMYPHRQVLVAAFREYGRDTGKRKDVTLYESNGEVKALRIAAASTSPEATD
jgi:hypothetical protein